MPVLLGPPGNLITIPQPAVPLDVDWGFKTAVHDLLGGRSVVHNMGYSREWDLQWPRITPANFEQIARLAMGDYGRDLRLIDPQYRNLLHPGAASCSDPREFNPSAGTLPTGAGESGLAVVWTPATNLGTSDTLECYLGHGVPVLPSTAYSMTARMKASAGTASTALRVQWRTSAGADISNTQQAQAVSTSYQTWTHQNQTSPANAAFAQLIVRPNAAYSSSVTLTVDSLQFEQATAATAWSMGGGSAKVAFVDKQLSYPRSGWFEASVPVVEVAP